jgi:hypothetical protein
MQFMTEEQGFEQLEPQHERRVPRPHRYKSTLVTFVLTAVKRNHQRAVVLRANWRVQERWSFQPR